MKRSLNKDLQSKQKQYKILYKRSQLMSTSKQQLKPNISDIYEVGDFIDAKDNQGDWRVGYIVDKNDSAKTFKVRFDGWPSKYDEFYRFGNPKLRQFRSIVVGYTGQKQNPAVRHGWKFSLQQLQNKLVDLHSYFAKESKKYTGSAHAFNQWIRGHNYLYVDFLMTVKFSTPQEIHTVTQFFKLNVLLSIKYLKDIIQNFDKFVQDLQKTNSEHLWDVQVAKSLAFHQIFDMIYTIAGAYQRLSSFFKDNEDLVRNQFDIPSNKQTLPGYRFKIVEYFYRNKGFDLVNELLEKIKGLNKSLSYTFLYSLAHLVSGLCVNTQFKLKQSFALQFKQIVNKSLEYLGDKQMKDFNQFKIIDLVHQILTISKNTSLEKSVQSWSQLIQIEIHCKMISCPFFEKKLRGINLLQQFIQKNVQTKKQEQQLDIIADGTLLKWIEDKKLFDVLFLNDNPQMIKKSTELIKYLYHRDNEMQKYIELIWKYRQGKHETALKEIYNFMGEVPNIDKNQQFTILLFLKHLSKLQQSLWDPEYLKMIKDYTINALTNCVSGQLKSTYGYQMIYNYSLKNQTDQNLVNYLIQILDKLKQYKIIQQLVTNYFICVNKNTHPRFHINLLVKILKQKIIDVRTIKLDCQQIIINRIIETKNLLTQNIQEQFQFLNQYLKQAKELIPDTNFIEFWNQMINSKGRVYFFKFLYKLRDSGRVVLTSFINEQTKKCLLQNFWTDEYLLKHQIDEFQATFLLQLFKFVNDKQQKIKRSNLIIKVLNQNLSGIQKLYSVYLSSNDPKTLQLLAKGLAEIYYSGSNSLAQSNVDLLGDFIQRIIITMKDFSEINNLQGVKKMLRLVQQLILRDEEIFNIQQNVTMYSFSDFSVKNLETYQENTMRLNLNQNIYSVKKIIGFNFNLRLNKFDIMLNEDEPITYQSYFKPLGQMDMRGTIWIKCRSQQTSRTKYYLNEFLEVFFQLLGNKAIEERVWNIVSKLPISNQIRQRILLSQNSLQILANDSFYKQLYMFKVAMSIQQSWWNNPLQIISKFFISRLQKTKGQTQIERQYLMVCGKLLQNIIQKDQTKNQQVLTQTFLSVFVIVKKMLLQSNQMPNINIFYIIKFLQSFRAIGEQLNNYLVKKQLVSIFPDAMTLILHDPQSEGFLKLCFIQHKIQSLRQQFPNKLIALMRLNKQKYAVKLAKIVLDDLLDSTINFQTKYLEPYINFGCYVLETMDRFLKQFYAEKKSFYFRKLYKLIEKQSAQKNIQAFNPRLNCYLSIIKLVIREVQSTQLKKFFIYLYSECLFKGNLSKCKSKYTRNSVFNVFVRLIKNNKTPQLVFQTFSHLHRNGLWRTRRLQDWTIVQAQRLKSSTNYVGLRNLGCICYMNSFFQQIFMIQEFRKSLLFVEDPVYDPRTLDYNVLFQVKKMFMNLIYSEKKAYNPKSFCIAFKDYEGKSTNVNQQMDIDQFSGILFDRLQNQLKGTKSPTLIKDTFGGVYSNEIICKGCPHFSESQQSFLSLGLTVKDKRSIYESLETMIKGDTLDGDNAYYCERCDKKVSAVKRVCIKKLPNYLIVALKRFEFDYSTMTKKKINDYCEFPQNLNLQEYSYQYLRKSQNIKSGQEDQEVKDKKYYQYKLKGVVIHMGSADNGHYYSLIQERSGEQRWIQFNDSTVKRFDIENLNDEAFGGQTDGVQNKLKTKNAYLLVYQRVQKINSMENQLERQGDQFKNMEMYTGVLQNIEKQNSQQNIENVLFSNEYSNFIKSLVNQASRKKTDIQLQKFIISAILTVIVRAKTLDELIQKLRNVYNSCCKGNKPLCEFILSQFCDLKIYEEFFRSCPIKEIKRNIAVWLGLILREVDDLTRQKFMKVILYKITKDNENNFEALTILHNLVEDQKCLKFMLENNLIGRLHENIIRREPRYFGSTVKLESALEVRQSYLGYQEIVEKMPFQLKKIKYDNESGYVWAILYRIVSKFPLQQLPAIINPKQVQYLYLTRDKIYKLLEQIKSKFDIDVLTSLLAYLSRQNMNFTIMLIQLIQKGLKQFQSKRYRQFFILFHKIINIQDNLIQERITGIFGLIRSLKENEKYAMDCTIIQLWLCKIINENQTLRNYLIREKGILKYLASLPLSKVPSDELSKKNVNFIETSVSKLHGIPFPPSRRGYIKILQRVQNFYQKLLSNEYQPINSFEGGNHIVYDKLVLGDRIAYFDVKDKVAYEEALIKQIFSDKILISRKISPNRSFWIWNDDEKLTSNLKVLKIDSSNELDSSKTTEMEDEIDFQSVN